MTLSLLTSAIVTDFFPFGSVFDVLLVDNGVLLDFPETFDWLFAAILFVAKNKFTFSTSVIKRVLQKDEHSYLLLSFPCPFALTRKKENIIRLVSKYPLQGMIDYLFVCVCFFSRVVGNILLKEPMGDFRKLTHVINVEYILHCKVGPL